MKKTLAFVVAFLLILTCACACFAEPAESTEPERTDAQQFKFDHEKMNGMMSMDGASAYQVLEIAEDNPVLYADLESIQMLLTEGTGILYLGFPECPWCRTLVPVLLEAVETNEFDGNIYYYNALFDRDKKSLDENGNIVTESEGTEMYQALLELLDEHLWAYEGLNDPTIKRVYFPMTVFVKDGEVIYSHIDTIPSQKDGYDPLTEEQHAELLDILSTHVKALMATEETVEE